MGRFGWEVCWGGLLGRLGGEGRCVGKWGGREWVGG